MTIVVPSSTQFVPDGTNLPQNIVWRNPVPVAATIVAKFASAQRDPAFPGVDFDLNINDDATGAIVFQRNSFWSERDVTYTQLITAGFTPNFGLEGGGEPKGTHQGTVFGFSLEVIFTDTAFGVTDRQVLVDVERKLDRRPYRGVEELVGINSSRRIELQPGVSAVGWFLTDIPTTARVTTGLPPYYFNLGFATPVTPQGHTNSTRIKFQSQLLELPPATTAVELTMAPGLVLTLTEYTVPFV
jgi:hypothetical protein